MGLKAVISFKKSYHFTCWN